MFTVYVEYSQILIIQFQIWGLMFAFEFFVKNIFENVKICYSAENGTPILLKFLTYASYKSLPLTSLKEFTVTDVTVTN
jgi:hypothetical protein